MKILQDSLGDFGSQGSSYSLRYLMRILQDSLGDFGNQGSSLLLHHLV